MTNCYLGSRYTNKEIKNSLKKYKKKVKLVKTKEDIYEFTSNKLIKKNIIGWFQDEAEFGPRALGNRSILAIPFPENIKDHINKNVKFRETFRPFAPAVMEEFAKKFFNIKQNSEHMLIATEVKKNMKKSISATVHVDNTCRVQTVNINSNKKFYHLLEKVNEKTNVPVLLNTSFNIKGQPIVNSPDDAIECLLKYKIDYLIIGNNIVTKFK